MLPIGANAQTTEPARANGNDIAAAVEHFGTRIPRKPMGCFGTSTTPKQAKRFAFNTCHFGAGVAPPSFELASVGIGSFQQSGPVARLPFFRRIDLQHASNSRRIPTGA